MTQKNPIKVIKREERAKQQTSAAKANNQRPTAQQAAREMVSTVTNWVQELQQRRRVETTRALKSLFPDPAQPNEA